MAQHPNSNLTTPAEEEVFLSGGTVNAKGDLLTLAAIARPPRRVGKALLQNGNGNLHKPTDRQRVIPDIEDNLEQAVRWLYDSVHEAERSIELVKEAGFLTETEILKLLKRASTSNVKVGSTNILNLVGGSLVSPQIAGVREVTTLPDITAAQDGELVFFNQVVYRFNGQAAVAPGVWEPIIGQVRLTQTITANALIPDPNASSINVPAGIRVRYVITQDSTGGWTVTWNGVFKGITATTVGRTANRVSIMEFDCLSTSPSVLVRILGVGDVDVS